MTTIDDRQWMDAQEISKTLRLSPRAVQGLFERGELKTETHEGEYYSRPAWVFEFVRQRNAKIGQFQSGGK